MARVGGEEFVIVLADADTRLAEQVLARIQDALKRAIAAAGLPPFTASFGVSDSSQADGLEGLLKLADEALYAAKRAGRDRVVVAGAPEHAGANGPDAVVHALPTR